MLRAVRNVHIRDLKSSNLSYVYMVILALYPLLCWYDANMPMGLGAMLLLGLSGLSILKNGFRYDIMPITFWCVCAYICFLWSYRSDFSAFTFFPPGGWIFFSFVISITSATFLFDLDILLKTMRWVLVVAIPLFWIQFLLLNITGTQQFCFVPNLTGHFTYEGFSYSDIVSRHLSGSHPCSIFLEKSYMAYYIVAYMSLTLFANEQKLLSKSNAIIILTVVMLRSGSGIVGMSILLLVKTFKLYWSDNIVRRIVMLSLLIPFFVGLFFVYQSTEAGEEIVGRQDELTTEGTSGYTRVVNGYLVFDQLSLSEKITGLSARNARETYGYEKDHGEYSLYLNGFQTILITLGYVGIFLYLLFYISLFRNVNLSSKMAIISLLIMSLIESNYLNAYMTLFTVVPCGQWYNVVKNKS